MNPKRHERAGKSLLELLIALTIIGLLMTLLIPAAFKLLKAAQNLGL